MKILGTKISSDQLFKLVFHLVLWSVWIGLPILNNADNERGYRFTIAIIPVALTNIPLFLLNSDWLIPSVFRRKGMATYLLSLLGLIVVFALFQNYFKEWIVPSELIKRHHSAFWAVVPVLFVTAISTGYGFIQLLLQQEKIRQQEQEERLKSELSFLRSQISPHFIFNVLNSIVYLIRSKSNQAESVTIKLSELMRYLLYESGDAQVSLGKELEYLKNYVELQKIRFEEDVDIRMNIEGSPGSQLIEPMLMIPFVENAFKHGVGLIAEPIIDIQLRIEEKLLTFSVKNKTAGNASEDKDNASGIGLRNVQRRLELLYPNKHVLNTGRNGEWFEVKMSIELHA
ncbi:MAG: histidine kinase [Saprospiraceae bacterium]|nr:histidine kinase [Saprospiraceae bacterium]MCF8250463.1 histidine kinase [Saprospiraceae bacterium]MCF8282759.1 histidine kinase [Bacteroidales bacterium]MCF8312391.1 histidine kinase [Saprospiraceae bacterium]MCF8440612.1 histidine kinase [Saprospiraceae bacterium]